MTTHTFVATTWHSALATLPPALTIASGDVVITETIDSNGWDRHGNKVCKAGNPMNGPFAVEGAMPGDTLRVDIIAMRPTRPNGFTRKALAANVVEPEFARHLPERRRVVWNIDANAQTATLDGVTGIGALTLPLEPMIGCFGVAPAGGEAISTATSGPFGGNMDYRRFAPGTTVWFPVFVPGALFFLGDCHALQGDGEVTGTGLETTYEVTVRLSIDKGPIVWPRGETEDMIFTVGNARPLEQALQHATTEMVRWLAELGMDTEAASHLLGAVVRYDIGNVFDPAFTVACCIPKQYLPKASR